MQLEWGPRLGAICLLLASACGGEDQADTDIQAYGPAQQQVQDPSSTAQGSGMGQAAQTSDAEQAGDTGPKGYLERIETPSGVVIDIIERGAGAAIQEGLVAEIHYRGFTIENGKRSKRPFESSLKRGKPYLLHYGKSPVISGWNIGLKGMLEGSKLRLHIPAKHAYGAKGLPPLVLGNRDLQFLIDVISVTLP